MEFSGFSNNSLEEQLAVIETAIIENQKEHEKFRVCHVELEEAIREASYAYEYTSEDLHLKIGKKPRQLHEKFDGPDVYSTIGSLASEITEMPHKLQSKIDSEKASVQIDVDKFKRDINAELHMNKCEWVAAFKEMKTAFIKSMQNFKKEIEEIRNDTRSSIGYQPQKPDLSLVNQQIDLKLSTTPLERFVNVDRLMNTMKNNQNVIETDAIDEIVGDKINEKYLTSGMNLENLKQNRQTS